MQNLVSGPGDSKVGVWGYPKPKLLPHPSARGPRLPLGQGGPDWARLDASERPQPGEESAPSACRTTTLGHHRCYYGAATPTLVRSWTRGSVVSM